MMPIIATTMSNSISEKPFWFLFVIFICSLRDKLVLGSLRRHRLCLRSARLVMRGYVNPRARASHDRQTQKRFEKLRFVWDQRLELASSSSSFYSLTVRVSDM